MDDEDIGLPPPIPSRPTRGLPTNSETNPPPPGGIPQIPPRPSARARSESPARAMDTSSEDLSSLNYLPPGPIRHLVETEYSDEPSSIPMIPPRPSKRPEKSHHEPDLSAEHPPIPQRPARRVSIEPKQTSIEETTNADYLIDGIEKQVPLLPATTDIDNEIAPGLQEAITIPEIPRRPIRRESMESPASEEAPQIPARPSRSHRTMSGDSDIPVIPRRPTRKASTEVPEEEYSVSSPQSYLPETDELPVIPQRPIRPPQNKSESQLAESEVAESSPPQSYSIKGTPDTSPPIESSGPPIPPRPVRVSSIKSISERSTTGPDDVGPVGPVIPPRPTRKGSRSSISSIPETSEKEPEANPGLTEPVITPRRPRKSSTASIPEKAEHEPEIEAESSEPVIPPRPVRKSSIKNTPEETSAEATPSIPRRPTRKSSTRSVQSQHSIEEEPESEKLPHISTKTVEEAPKGSEILTEEPELIVNEPPEPPTVPRRPQKPAPKDVDEPIQPPDDAAPSIEEMSTSTYGHPAVPSRPKEEEPAPPEIPIQQAIEQPHPTIPARPPKRNDNDAIPVISPPPEKPKDDIPPTPARPEKKKPEEPSSRSAPLTSSIPFIPPRPIKSKPQPKPAEVVPSQDSVVESLQESGSSNRRPIETGPIPDVKPSASGAPTTVSEIQSGVPTKPTPAIVAGVKSPPIPARPQHRLAKQFEQQQQKEKPIPPPRPAKPLVSGGKFAGLRAQFAKDLNERLGKPAPPPPVSQKKEEETHSTQPEVTPKATEVKGSAEENVEKAVEEGKVSDVRKGRARGPQRRPPTVKPIIPAGWGVSTITTVFEQRITPEVPETEEGRSEEQSKFVGKPTEDENMSEPVFDNGKAVLGVDRIDAPTEPENMEPSAPIEIPEFETMEIGNIGIKDEPKAETTNTALPGEEILVPTEEATEDHILEERRADETAGSGE